VGPMCYEPGTGQFARGKLAIAVRFKMTTTKPHSSERAHGAQRKQPHDSEMVCCIGVYNGVGSIKGHASRASRERGRGRSGACCRTVHRRPL